ncbi:MAG TPA: DUF1214 domain-containing protein [Candidatus Binatia bacterium]
MSSFAPETRQAFHELLDLLREIGDTHFTPERGIIEEVTAAEGYRFLIHLLAAGCENRIDGDPERPMFTRVVSPQRKVLGDNPDAIYYWTRIDGAGSYRIRGFLDGAVYTSFTVHATDPGGGSLEKVIGEVSDRDFTVGSDGGYEITLSPQEHKGNWIKLEAGATSVITRHYFERPRSVAADPDVFVRLRIDRLDDPGMPAPWTDAKMAARFRALGGFLRGNTLDMPKPGQGPEYSFVSRVPNVLPRPARFGASGVAAWGAVDIYYAMAPYLLQPDEALVMEGRLPACRFANVMLWNMHLQTLEYRFRRTSLNRQQMTFESDGSFRVVIAHRNPGVANWLDTEGHMLGTIFWRILLPESEAGEIRCSLRNVSEL